jgi:hypothetical protein
MRPGMRSRALVLLVPAVPAAFAFEPIDIPVEDPSSLWLPPLPMRAPVFWDKVSRKTPSGTHPC